MHARGLGCMLLMRIFQKPPSYRSPQPPTPWKNCLSWNRSLVPKGWGPLLERFLILCLLTFQPRLPPLVNAKLILLAWQFSMIHANEFVIIVVETNILRLSLTGWPLLLTNSECSLYVKIMNSETRLLYTPALLFTSHVTSGQAIWSFCGLDFISVR